MFRSFVLNNERSLRHPQMFFKKESKPEAPSAEEELEMLSNRLEGSVYYEDKMNTLDALLKMSDLHPVAAGTYAMKNVIHSMKDMDEASVQLHIIRNIFLCSHKLEFVDMIIEDLDCMKILCDCLKAHKNQGDAYDILCEMSTSQLFVAQIMKIPNIAHYLVQMIRECKTALLPVLIEKSLDFKSQVVFEGIFEALLEVLGKEYSREVVSILTLLLRNCPFNQNYFNDLDWRVLRMHLSHQEVFDVLTSLVDLKNLQYPLLQSTVYSVVGLADISSHRQWLLIYLITKDCPEYLEEFVNKALSFDDMSRTFARDACARQNEACLLLNNILLHRVVQIPDLGSYKVYVIQSLREQEMSTSISRRTLEEVKSFENGSPAAVFDALVFVIFNFDVSLAEEFVPSFVEMFSDYTRLKIHRSLCLIILLMLDTPLERIGINTYGVAASLRETRLFLCAIDLDSAFYMTDEMVDMLLDNIGELIGRYSTQSRMQSSRISEVETRHKDAGSGTSEIQDVYDI